MKICDLTQFYSPRSGGVKRYLHEKAAYIDKHSPRDEQILIVPGPKSEVQEAGRSRIYSIHSPLVSRTARYRALLNLRAVEEIIERERPGIIESSDPYQIGWRALSIGERLQIPVVAFYHSHFVEAHVRGAVAGFLGRRIDNAITNVAQQYVSNLYNRFEATFVPSENLAQVLRSWGVNNVRVVGLGVNTDIFNAAPNDSAITRHSLGVTSTQKLLLYVGRLAKEKNTETLFKTFDLLQSRRPAEFRLLVIGDGPQRAELEKLRAQSGDVSWIPYCNDSAELARYYRAADLFVHPGVREVFGLVALESQACGTPVVGIRGGNLPIFHEQESWAAENTPESFADAIEQFSAKELSILGAQAAMATNQRYSWPRIFEQLFCIYGEVCAKYAKFAPS